MKRTLIVTTTIVILGLIGGVVLAQSGNDLFGQALIVERSEGNMPEAIKLYQNIVAKFPNDRRLVSRALLQIGLCYEKLGNAAEARKAFDRLVGEFKSETEYATAKSHLGKLDTTRFAGMGGVIFGSVTERNLPVANATVWVVKNVYLDGQRTMMPVLSARTNSVGEYSVTGLRPGKYYVTASINDASSGLGPANNPQMHVPIYFPGTPDWKRATLAEIRKDETVLNMTIDVAAVPVRRIRGTATNATPVVNGTTVTMMVRNLPMPIFNLDPILTVPVDPSGAFEIPRVPAGSYVLYASQPGGNGGRVDIEVRDRDVIGVSIPMNPGLTVSGRILPPANGVRVTLRLDPLVRGATNYTAVSAPDGTFRIALGQNTRPLQSGDYRVSAEPLLAPPTAPQDKPPTPRVSSLAYVQSIRLGEADVLNDGLHLRGQPEHELVITVGTTPGALGGRVVNVRGEPAPLSTVVLIPEGGIRFRVDHKFIAPDASGRFLFERIPPGDYRLFAWEGVTYGEWQDPDFVLPDESRGRQIQIKARERHEDVEVVGIPLKP